jgi:hypothetical protein
MPRGTYDDATSGTGGYVVPRYVLDEGIGQGTFTTKWLPSGTYAGPRVPNWLNQRPQVVAEKRMPGGGKVVTVQPLGDDQPLPKPIEDYGTKAAQSLLARVGRLPAGQRQAALQAIVNRVDKSLWSRTQDIWRRYRAQGVPADRAFQMALARAMSAGIAAEIIHTGIRGEAPQAKSLLGLGCYGCWAALGADEAAPAMCPPPAGFTWVAATTGAPGHWERARAGQTPMPGPCDPSTGKTPVPTVADHRTQRLEVGPWSFPVEIKRSWANGRPSPTLANRLASPDLIFTSPDQLSKSQAEFIGKELTRALDGAGNGDKMVTDYLSKDAPKTYGFSEHELPAVASWYAKFGLMPGTPVRMHWLWYLRQSNGPIAKLKHPTTGDDLQLNMYLAQADHSKDADAAANPVVLKVWLSKITEPNAFFGALNAITTVIGVVRDVVVEALEELADIACDLISSPGGQIAGAGVAGAAGVPPKTGAVGVAIAKDACGRQPPPLPPLLPQSPSVIPVLLVGGAVAAVALLTGKRKGHP